MASEGKISVAGVLLLYHHQLAADAATVMENINAFAEHSRFRVWSVNTAFGFPKSLSRMQFQVVVLHYPLPREFHRILKPGAGARVMVYNRDSLWVHLYAAYEKLWYLSSQKKP